MPNLIEEGTRGISAVVWLGCLALLFLAVAVHEGWLGGSKAAIQTSATSPNIGQGSSSPGIGGDYSTPANGSSDDPSWLEGLIQDAANSPWTGLIL